ncbi:hypothetical protein ABZ917_46730 [Nonomuraea wenchangensis]
MFALYRLIALRGLRRGESVGPRWKDVDLDAGSAGVRWQIAQLGWETIQGKPKTEASDRVIALDADTVAVLRAHKRSQAADRLAAGEAWADSGFVFTSRSANRCTLSTSAISSIGLRTRLACHQ